MTDIVKELRDEIERLRVELKHAHEPLLRLQSQIDRAFHYRSVTRAIAELDRLRDTAKAALEALESTKKGRWPDDAHEVIDALRAALASTPATVVETETVEPVAWVDPHSGEQRVTPRPAPHKRPPQFVPTPQQRPLLTDEQRMALATVLAHYGNDPRTRSLHFLHDATVPAPQQRKPLTPERLQEVIDDALARYMGDVDDNTYAQILARAVEAAVWEQMG